MRYPGQKNSLDALCKRLGVDNSGRTLHGALLDAQILAEVFLVMTGGQGNLSLDAPVEVKGDRFHNQPVEKIHNHAGLPEVRVSQEEQAAHEEMMALLRADSEEGCVWDQVVLEKQGP
jgi:DNA polymerase-3 subunit epsilon